MATKNENYVTKINNDRLNKNILKTIVDQIKI